MREEAASRRFGKWRGVAALVLCGIGLALVVLGTRPAKPPAQRSKTLSVSRLDLKPRTASAASQQTIPFKPIRANGAALPPDAPTFGHPVISGIGGTGFEQAIRIDPSNPDRIYTSTPGTLSADTSWIWRSLDAGKTFKWIPNAAPLIGKVLREVFKEEAKETKKSKKKGEKDDDKEMEVRRAEPVEPKQEPPRD